MQASRLCCADDMFTGQGLGLHATLQLSLMRVRLRLSTPAVKTHGALCVCLCFRCSEEDYDEKLELVALYLK